MSAFIDLSGQRFGRLLVVKRVASKHQRVARWRCRCSCENVIETNGSTLRRGSSLSCGCLRKELWKIGRREYNSWRSMLARCYNPESTGFESYGGRGIKVCRRWRGKNGFVNFLRDNGKRPIGTSLDRYPDKNGDYKPGNTRWATPKQQIDNRRDKKEFGWKISAALTGRKRIQREAHSNV